MIASVRSQDEKERNRLFRCLSGKGGRVLQGRSFREGAGRGRGTETLHQNLRFAGGRKRCKQKISRTLRGLPKKGPELRQAQQGGDISLAGIGMVPRSGRSMYRGN